MLLSSFLFFVSIEYHNFSDVEQVLVEAGDRGRGRPVPSEGAHEVSHVQLLLASRRTVQVEDEGLELTESLSVNFTRQLGGDLAVVKFTIVLLFLHLGPLGVNPLSVERLLRLTLDGIEPEGGLNKKKQYVNQMGMIGTYLDKAGLADGGVGSTKLLLQLRDGLVIWHVSTHQSKGEECTLPVDPALGRGSSLILCQEAKLLIGTSRCLERRHFELADQLHDALEVVVAPAQGHATVTHG